MYYLLPRHMWKPVINPSNFLSLMFGMLPLDTGTPPPTSAQGYLDNGPHGKDTHFFPTINYDTLYHLRVLSGFSEFGCYKSTHETLGINIKIAWELALAHQVQDFIRTDLK